MPDGSPSLVLLLPSDLVQLAVRDLARPPGHPWVQAAVVWLHFLRAGEVVDARALAEHYALWCFDKAYYERFNRLVASARLF